MADLLQEMETNSPDTGRLNEKIESINSAAFDLRFEDIRRAITMMTEVAEQIERDGTDEAEVLSSLANTLFNLGCFHSIVGEYDAALEIFQKALSLYEKFDNQHLVILTLAQISSIHLHQSSFVEALEYALRGFDLAHSSNDKELEAVLLNNLSSVYIQREEYTRALQYLLKSLQLAQDSSNQLIQAGAMQRICCVYTALNNPEAGLDAGRKSLELYREAGDLYGEIESLNSLGQAFQSLQNFSSAEDHYHQAAGLAEKTEFRYELVRSMYLTAELDNQKGELQPAVNTLEKALKVAVEIRTNGWVVEIHRALSAAFRGLQNYQKALYHYEGFHENKELIFNAETESKLHNLEMVFQVEAARREAELEQEKNLALQQEINERIQIEQALKVANEQLQAEIHERELLIGDLDAFARTVAHDLKTPLQNLALLSYILERELVNYPNADSPLSLVKQIQQTGLKTGSIINELLTMASLRSTDVEYRPLDMNAVVQEVMERLKLIVEERGAEVVLTSDFPLAQGHAPWIEEVMANFITNAIHYGGEPPKIEVGADPAENGCIRFWVKDNGDGISPQDQEKLFHDFTRLETRRAGGHGLGLSITRRIITKLGGKVGVDSSGKAGEGAVFWFTLPVAVKNKSEGS